MCRDSDVLVVPNRAAKWDQKGCLQDHQNSVHWYLRGFKHVWSRSPLTNIFFHGGWLNHQPAHFESPNSSGFRDRLGLSKTAWPKGFMEPPDLKFKPWGGWDPNCTSPSQNSGHVLEMKALLICWYSGFVLDTPFELEIMWHYDLKWWRDKVMIHSGICMMIHQSKILHTHTQNMQSLLRVCVCI